MYDKTTKSIIHNTQQQLLLFVFIVTHNDVYAAFSLLFRTKWPCKYGITNIF